MFSMSTMKNSSDNTFLKTSENAPGSVPASAPVSIPDHARNIALQHMSQQFLGSIAGDEILKAKRGEGKTNGGSVNPGAIEAVTVTSPPATRARKSRGRF